MPGPFLRVCQPGGAEGWAVGGGDARSSGGCAGRVLESSSPQMTEGAGGKRTVLAAAVCAVAFCVLGLARADAHGHRQRGDDTLPSHEGPPLDVSLVMDRRELEHLLEVTRQARATNEPLAMATVVRVKGNAYRREGTRMVVRQNGTYECALSGGCLEPSVAAAAARVFSTGEPVIVTYDLADDSIWGLGIGCSGAVDIRIERLEDDAITKEWLGVLDRGEKAVLLTPLSGASGRMIVRGTDSFTGSLTNPDIERATIALAGERLGAAYPQSGSEWIDGGEIFFEVSIPPPELAIFGAGDDAMPVAQLAWQIGFAVTVIDAREASLTPARFPGAALVSAHFSEFAQKVKLPAGSFVVVMNHHLERDRESLRFSLESDAAYIGMLGPRSRYEKLLADLEQQGYRPDSSKLSRVRSPVGLSLGAEAPQEVAVSILGEILALQRGFEGGFLTGSTDSLHRPAAKRAFARS